MRARPQGRRRRVRALWRPTRKGGGARRAVRVPGHRPGEEKCCDIREETMSQPEYRPREEDGIRSLCFVGGDPRHPFQHRPMQAQIGQRAVRQGRHLGEGPAIKAPASPSFGDVRQPLPQWGDCLPPCKGRVGHHCHRCACPSVCVETKVRELLRLHNRNCCNAAMRKAHGVSAYFSGRLPGFVAPVRNGLAPAGRHAT